MPSADLVLRNVEIDGRPGLDVRLEDGRIAEIGARLGARGEDLDGRGGALIPGLIDHHIHLLATAAQRQSLRLEGLAGAAGFERAIRGALAARALGVWLRATGYHERIAGDLDRAALDRLAPEHPVRIQHQTGSLWVLNSAALARLDLTDAPEAVERDAAGRPTGRIWRGDSWLREQLAAEPPDLAPLGRELARFGITGVTDTSATTDARAARILGEARRSVALPQRLTLMSAGALPSPADGAFDVGAVKVLLDDARLPDLDDLTRRIDAARAQSRAVAVHCVTAGELALTLAAFESAGARTGDRIEHGGVIPAEAIPVLKRLALTVVTQPAFVFERGDRYLAEVEPREQGDLYRCASLLKAGIPVAASSDAPYASPDPWAGVAAAARRRTRAGRPLGEAEQVDARTALDLYLGARDAPGGPPRRLRAGAPADLCLLRRPLAEALAEPCADQVRAAAVGGTIVHLAD